MVHDLDVVEAALRSHWVAARYRARENLAPPIPVAPAGQPLVALEGHTRLVAWLLAERTDPLKAIVGSSERLGGWAFL